MKTQAERNQEVAATILEQLGGRRFIAMTGAKHLAAVEFGLTFQLPGKPGFVKHGICALEVKLARDDTYTLRWFAGRGVKIREYATQENIYADDLQRVFTHMTGLDCKL